MRFDEILLNVIKSKLPELEKLYTDISGHWEYEDMVYRFYHHSFKVFYIQGYTKKIVTALEDIDTETRKKFEDSGGNLDVFQDELNERFIEIIEAGTNKSFNRETTNSNWMNETVPLLTAFFHAKYFLEMCIHYGKQLESAPNMLPSGWAAVLTLFNCR